jgi:UDP-galactopyranose mutase
VLASHRGELFPIPVNRTTLERFFKIQLPDDQAAMALLDRIRESRAPIRTSEDTVLNSVGRELYQAFFAGYTLKQWGRDASQLDSSVIARIPVRTDRDDRYFSDRHQAMPRDGYTAMFMRMLNHPGIRVELGTDYTPSRHRLLARHLVYTGPLDAFFNYRLGALPYRSIRFELEHHAGALIQPVGTINNPDPSTPYTRVSEFRHLTGQQCSGTTLAREFPQAEGEPYYPIPTPETRELARQYTALADHENDVTFVGRLAQYRYYNMDQVVAAALTRAERVLAATV